MLKKKSRLLFAAIIKKVCNKLGLEITRKSDLFQTELYKKLYTTTTLSQKPFYNVGAGSFWHPFWTNIDFVSDWYKDVQKNVLHHDLLGDKPLPIGEASAEIIYSSHTIEHIPEFAVKRFFADAFKSLKTGGIIRITTGPDAETDFRAMINGDEHWFYWNNWYEKPGTYESIYHKPANSVPLEERWLHHFASALAPNDISPSQVKFHADQIKEIINEYGFPKALDFFTSKCTFDPQRPGNHISWWTHDKIIQFLLEAGFTGAYRSGYGQSSAPILRNTRLFDSTHPQISIYVEGKKS